MQRPDSEELEKRLYEMKTGDYFVDNISGWHITRAPGGWIYSHDAVVVFVPEVVKPAKKENAKPATKPEDVVLPAKKTRGK